MYSILILVFIILPILYLLGIFINVKTDNTTKDTHTKELH